MNNQPILYSFRRCPYAMRARLAIASAQVNCELREITLRNKPKKMLEVSPKGTVPVLELGNGGVIDESLDIALWALEQDDPENMLPKNAVERDEILALIASLDQQFKPQLDQYKYEFHSAPETAKAARDAAMVFLRQLNDRLAEHAFLFGNQIGFADICTLPFVRQFAHVDKDWFWAQEIEHVIGWLDTFLASQRFAAIMPKFAVWEPDDEPVAFPTALQPN